LEYQESASPIQIVDYPEVSVVAKERESFVSQSVIEEEGWERRNAHKFLYLQITIASHLIMLH
jgi:hypothetical protein